MAAKLKPCPFCGSENLSIEVNEHWKGPPLFDGYVLCLDCGASGGAKDHQPNEREARGWAIALWNRRGGNAHDG